MKRNLTSTRWCSRDLMIGLFVLLILATLTTSSTAERAAVATRLNGQTIHVDGSLYDDAWTGAEFTSKFVQKDPVEGAPAGERTEIAFLYDEEALYIGARLFKENTDDIRASVSRRDNAGNSERVVVTLDTYQDKRTSYSFCVTATGVRVDYYHPEDSEDDRDYTYDPVWEAKTEINGIGWTAEMRIPFSQLRFKDQEEHVWGLNVNRWVPSINEDAYWVHIPKDETGWASRFGELQGLEGIRPARRVELMPYFASDETVTNDFDANDPFTDGNDYQGRLGGDLKMGLGPNLTLDATFNPDFGQVEADPAVVNLSAFEIFFDEKRPFFTEGSQLLQGNGPSYFYSRRIGAPPHGSADGDFVRTPDNTTILSAGKLSGRLNSGLSIGTLGAVTGREYADTYDESTATQGKTKVEPLTGFGAMRLQQEFGKNSSTAGLSLTGVQRDFAGSRDLAERLNRRAIAGGGDWRLRSNGGKYQFGGYAGFSRIEGTPDAILRAQRSSRRYYQRPDADYVDLDSSRTSLSGYTVGAYLEQNAGKHWLWELGGSAESPGFEINDAGRLRSADGLDTWANLRYRENSPGSWYRNYWANVNLNNGWNYGGIPQNIGTSTEAGLRWNNFWSSWLGYWNHQAVKSDDLTRGGPLMETLDAWGVWLGTQNNWASNTTWNFNVSYSYDALDTWAFNVNSQLGFKPGERWQFSLRPRYSRNIDGRQYIDRFDNGRDATYGNRYVFGWIDGSTISTQFRLNYSITPDLSIEAYAEPFVSTGDYYRYGELKEAGSGDLLYYGEYGGTETTVDEEGATLITDGDDEFEIDNQDFNYVSLRSNTVLRWEWRPGSSLYLVWQQNRSRSDENASLVGGKDLFNTFDTEGENFFAFKVSYWLPYN